MVGGKEGMVLRIIQGRNLASIFQLYLKGY